MYESMLDVLPPHLTKALKARRPVEAHVGNELAIRLNEQAKQFVDEMGERAEQYAWLREGGDEDKALRAEVLEGIAQARKFRMLAQRAVSQLPALEKELQKTIAQAEAARKSRKR